MMINELNTIITAVKQKQPVILCFTNQVTMDLVANTLLALGASPIMSFDSEEFEELIELSQAVYINIGTLNRDFNHNIFKACELIAHHNKPWVLDPVGAGATQVRTRVARQLLKWRPIIRANASETLALLDDATDTLGVEAVHAVSQANQAADELAKKLTSTVVVSGETDRITDGSHQRELAFGSKLMRSITGMGCALSATIAAFHSVSSTSFEAAALATAYFGLCGHLAERRAIGPATFRQALIDELHHADLQAITDLIKNKQCETHQ